MDDENMVKKNVFVLAMDDFNRSMLERLRGSESIRFHPLLDTETAVDTRDYDIPHLLERARRTLAEFPEPIDGIVGYWDFPTSTMLPVLRREQGLPGPSLESVLRCEHKYWARLEQARVAPEDTPRFAAVNPFADDVVEHPPLDYPFWLKPVRAHSSQLGFRVGSDTDWAHAVERTREGIGVFAEPFNHFFRMAELTEEIREIDGWHCIAEEMISEGHQCTVEGYVLNGRVRIYGVVDSMRQGEANSSFSRYQYPSTLPESVIDRMDSDAVRFLGQVEYDNAPFNIEFFYNEDRDRLQLLEANTRCSKSHSPLFEMVDGASNLQAMVDVELGREANFPPEGGPCRHATKFMLREDTDAFVERVPTEQEVRAIEDEFEHVRIQIEASQGRRLSDMLHQDQYTFEIATLFVGGDSVEEVERKGELVKNRLEFRLRR